MRTSLMFLLLAIGSFVLLPAVPADAQCPWGYEWHRGRCRPISPVVQCPFGYEWRRGRCVPVAPVVQCPFGTEWRRGRCRPIRQYVPPPVVVPKQGAGRVFKTVSASTLNVRQCASRACGVVAVIHRGQRVRILGFESGYYYIRIPQTGITGWSSARFLYP